jgi:carbonic anhydrase/acetyltransferase-like protein (isoleucine patch superfamily)
MPLYEYCGIRPVLGNDVFLADSATVIGDVVLGDQASVWYSVVIRGDVFPIRIGARTNIQDGTVIHITNGKSATTIGDDVTVGHMALLHGCTVKDRTLIGMGAVVLDDAVVGEESIVAAGALVPPRMVVPPRSLVMGRPAKVARALTEKDGVWGLDAAKLYVEYARTFMTRVKRID